MLAQIALTPGEPAGIGPDVLIAAAQKSYVAEIIAICDPDLIAQRAKLLGIPLTILPYEQTSPAKPHQAGRLTVLPIPLKVPSKAGQLEQNNAAYVLQTLDTAIDLCHQGVCHSLVTGPVHKGVINDAGFSFTGHTEYLAKNTQSSQPVMLLQTEGLRVALATTHMPLRKVCDAITTENLSRVLAVLRSDLHSKMGIHDPVIYVCGLNPHAGEGGHLGDEEIEIISPLIDKLKSESWRIVGPLAADTAFSPQNIQRADVFLAMYHDQGLPVLKYKGFGQAVNITLGLPFPRTSVDHGTALELAGSGKAKSRSMELAIASAIAMVKNLSQTNSNYK